MPAGQESRKNPQVAARECLEDEVNTNKIQHRKSTEVYNSLITGSGMASEGNIISNVGNEGHWLSLST